MATHRNPFTAISFDSHMDNINDQRRNLLEETQQLDHAGDRLQTSHRLALETEQLGATVLSDLRRQREQIVRASNTLHETDANLDRSNRIMRDMLRRYQ